MFNLLMPPHSAIVTFKKNKALYTLDFLESFVNTPSKPNKLLLYESTMVDNFISFPTDNIISTTYWQF